MATRLSHTSARLVRLTSQSPAVLPSSRRTLFGLGKKKAADAAPTPLLSQDDLFHPLAASPFPEMRAKAQRIKDLAFCPVSMDKYGEKVHVAFDCPDCGYPTHATEERWAEDMEKGRYWPRLREANEDEHDLRSGREMTEFNLPGRLIIAERSGARIDLRFLGVGEQPYEEAVSMGNWDVFLYTRGFPSVNTERSRRHVSKLLTYPMSIGSVLHENSPYTLRNQRLLPEGLRSLFGEHVASPMLGHY